MPWKSGICCQEATTDTEVTVAVKQEMRAGAAPQQAHGLPSTIEVTGFRAKKTLAHIGEGGNFGVTITRSMPPC